MYTAFNVITSTNEVSGMVFCDQMVAIDTHILLAVVTMAGVDASSLTNYKIVANESDPRIFYVTMERN